MQDSNKKWQKIGEIGVDAGLCWIGDPCYVLHEKPNAIGKDWDDFCRMLEDQTTQFNYDLGHPGLGVCVQTGHGDGTYDVDAIFKDGVVKEIRVRFF